MTDTIYDRCDLCGRILDATNYRGTFIIAHDFAEVSPIEAVLCTNCERRGNEA